MSEGILHDENFKKSIAQRVFLLNLIPGVIGLCFSLMLFLVAFPYQFLFAFPIVGYGLLWAYWIEFKKTTKLSQTRWFISIVFNLVGIAVNVFNFTRPGIRWNLESFGLIIPPLLWMVSMCYASFLGMGLSRKINHGRSKHQTTI